MITNSRRDCVVTHAGNTGKDEIFSQLLIGKIVPDCFQNAGELLVVSCGEARPHLEAELPDPGQEQGMGLLSFFRKHDLVATPVTGEAFAHGQFLTGQLIDDAGHGRGILEGAVGKIRLGGGAGFVQLVQHHPLFGGNVDTSIAKSSLELCLEQAGGAVQNGTDVVVR